MIHTKQLHHVSINVTNIEVAREFYSEVLCLKEIQRPNFDFPGAWFDIGGLQQLHLIEMPSSQTLRNNKELSSREGHFALRVTDFDETLQWLQSKNIEVLDKRNSRSGFAQIFCTDPDGNLIELNVNKDQ